MLHDCPEISNAEKESVWAAYRAGRPTRVPVSIASNPRVVLLNPSLNADGLTFQRVFDDPGSMMEAALQHERYRRTVIHRYCDSPTGLPEAWAAGVSWLNCHEAVFFGASLHFREGQIPDTEPFLAEGDRERIFRVDITRPLETGIYRKGLDFQARMCELAEGREFHGRPIRVARYAPTGTDGPLTSALNLRGAQFLEEMATDRDYAERLLDFLTDATILRTEAVRKHWGDERIGAGFADDSVQLISPAMYREIVLPRHRRFYERFYPDQARSIHLCGDVMRHMKALVGDLNVRSFDTGFPVDFAWVRRELGPEVEIKGGPGIAVLLNGRPQEVYDATCRVLESGIMAGGRFMLTEANNLPPCVPEENLAAMYRAALDKGVY